MSFINSVKSKKGVRRYIGPKRMTLLVLLAVFVSMAWDYYKRDAINPAIIEGYIEMYPITGVLLFVAVYVLSVVATLPSLPLNLAAGFFWGGLVGGVYSATSATLGGWLSFLVARWLLGQPLTNHFENSLISKVQYEFEKYGWKFVAFARVNPVIPTGLLNYILGLTSLSNQCFLCVSFIFLLPPSIAIAYIGDTLQTFIAQRTDVREILSSILIVSAAITSLVVIKFITTICAKRMKEE